MAAGSDSPALATVEVLGWRGPEYYAMDAWRGKWDTEGGGVLVNQSPGTIWMSSLFWFMGPAMEVCGHCRRTSITPPSRSRTPRWQR